MSDETPYGQPSPYGPPPTGQPSPYGQAPTYGTPQPAGDRRPGTVTAAAWITLVFSAITAALFGFAVLTVVVARDQAIAEMEKAPEFQDAGIDPEAALGVLVAVMVGLVVWAVIAMVLAVLVLRRSNVSRILLVISSAVTALFSLLLIFSVVTAVPLIAAVATIVLLFIGGAGDWFKRTGPGGYAGGPTGYPGAPYGDQHGSQYGGTYGVQPGPDAPPQYPSPDNPYGQQPPTADNPYGQQPPSDGGTEYPPRDYPNR